jgi:hypothetical protein
MGRVTAEDRWGKENSAFRALRELRCERRSGLCHDATVMWDGGRRWSPIWVVATVVLCVAAVTAGVFEYRYLTGGPTGHAAGHDESDYLDIGRAALLPPPPAATPDASTGTFRVECGHDENGHRNADNLVASPRLPGDAHHLHDYVGNMSTNAFSTDETLAAARTTCANDDKSTYYWPVLRVPAAPGDAASHGDDADGNHGEILVPDSAFIELRGNPTGNVVGMPEFLRASTGNAHGFSSGGVNTQHVQWTCSGARDHFTEHYPRCAPGQQVVRVFDFPSCWNGLTTDSANHRTHVVFPNAAGACPAATFPVPQLHMEVAYTVPPGADYSIDTFPEEQHRAIADHGDFINVMPAALMSKIVDCLNADRRC